MSKNISWIAVAVLAAGLLVTTAVNAGTPAIKEKGKVLGTVELLQDVGNLTTSATLFTVPAGQQLVVTDILISNSNAGDVCCQRIFRSGTDAIPLVAVQVGDTAVVNLNTGLAFDEGDTLQIRNGQSGGTTRWFVGGYLKKMPK